MTGMKRYDQWLEKWKVELQWLNTVYPLRWIKWGRLNDKSGQDGEQKKCSWLLQECQITHYFRKIAVSYKIKWTHDSEFPTQDIYWWEMKFVITRQISTLKEANKVKKANLPWVSTENTEMK